MNAALHYHLRQTALISFGLYTFHKFERLKTHNDSSIPSDMMKNKRYFLEGDRLSRTKDRLGDDIVVSDQTVARYLINNKGNELVSAKQIRSALEWEERHLPIDLTDEQFIDEFAKGIVYVRGTDKENRPVFVVNARLYDPINRDLELQSKGLLFWIDRAIKSLPPDKSKFVILIDYSGCCPELDQEIRMNFLPLFKALYPERVEKIYIYPTSIFFWGAWNVGKWMLDAETRSKVEPILMLSALQQKIQNEFIPKCIGGASTYVYNYVDFLQEPISDQANTNQAILLKPSCTSSKPSPENMPPFPSMDGQRQHMMDAWDALDPLLRPLLRPLQLNETAEQKQKQQHIGESREHTEHSLQCHPVQQQGIYTGTYILSYLQLFAFANKTNGGIPNYAQGGRRREDSLVDAYPGSLSPFFLPIPRSAGSSTPSSTSFSSFTSSPPCKLGHKDNDKGNKVSNCCDPCNLTATRGTRKKWDQGTLHPFFRIR